MANPNVTFWKPPSYLIAPCGKLLFGHAFATFGRRIALEQPTLGGGLPHKRQAQSTIGVPTVRKEPRASMKAALEIKCRSRLGRSWLIAFWLKPTRVGKTQLQTKAKSCKAGDSSVRAIAGFSIPLGLVEVFLLSVVFCENQEMEDKGGIP